MTHLKNAEDALLESQRLLFLYLQSTDIGGSRYPQRIGKRIAEALDAVSDLKTQAKCAGGVTLRE